MSYPDWIWNEREQVRIKIEIPLSRVKVAIT